MKQIICAIDSPRYPTNRRPFCILCQMQNSLSVFGYMRFLFRMGTGQEIQYHTLIVVFNMKIVCIVVHRKQKTVVHRCPFCLIGIRRMLQVPYIGICIRMHVLLSVGNCHLFEEETEQTRPSSLYPRDTESVGCSLHVYL